MNNKLSFITETLYARNLDSENITDDEMYAYEDLAESAIQQFGWDAVFVSWNEYLRTNCKTGFDAVNFANLFYCYDGVKHPIPDPYGFLAFFYYLMDLKPAEFDAVDIMDGISTEILLRNGYLSQEQAYDYIPEKDDHMVAAVEKLMEKNK